MSTEQVFRGWDKGLEYKEQKKRLEKLLDETGLFWIAIYLIQLENGSRIGEAVNCYLAWCKNGKQEQLITVEKRKDKMQRRMIIPKPVHIRSWPADLLTCYKDPIDVAATYCTRLLGYNSHALRHCRLSYWLFVKKYPAPTVAKSVGMKSIGTLMNYMQEVQADAMLREAIE